MTVTVTKQDFVKAFDSYNRSNNFSVWAREALFDYLEEIDPDMELDVIAVCCEYEESTVDEIIENYSVRLLHADDHDDEDTKREAVIAFLERHTSVVADLGDSVVFAQF